MSCDLKKRNEHIKAMQLIVSKGGKLFENHRKWNPHTHTHKWLWPQFTVKPIATVCSLECGLNTTKNQIRYLIIAWYLM